MQGHKYRRVVRQRSWLANGSLAFGMLVAISNGTETQNGFPEPLVKRSRTMKSLQSFFSVLLLCCLGAPCFGVDFATQASPWQSSRLDRWAPNPNTLGGYESFPNASRQSTAYRNALYWVERDLRYTPSLPSVQRTTYRPVVDDYRTQRGYGDGRRGACRHGGVGSYAPGSPNPAYYGSPISEGYYKGDGLFGKDTMYARDQPVRNFFRYLMP